MAEGGRGSGREAWWERRSSGGGACPEERLKKLQPQTHSLPPSHLGRPAVGRALLDEVLGDGQPQLAAERLVALGLPRDAGRQLAVKGEGQGHGIFIQSHLREWSGQGREGEQGSL